MGVRSLGSKIAFLFVIVVVMITSGGCVGLGGQQAGWSGVTVADGNIYFGSTGGSVVAMNAESGSEIWRKPFEVSSSGGLGCAPSEVAVPLYGTPVVLGELLYIAGFDGKVYAINTNSGAERWIYPRQGNLHSFVGGLVMNEDRLYLGSIGGVIYALDAETGDLVWRLETGEQMWATPAIDGDTLFIGTFDKKLYAVDINTGNKKWQQPFETQGPVISTPIVNDGIVYIGSFDRHIYALNAISGELIWKFPDIEGNGENIPQKWFWASPVLYEGVIYAANMDGRVYVIDIEDGNLITLVELEGAISSTPAATSDKIFIATEDGNIFYINTENNLAMELPILSGMVTAPLSVIDGMVYIHTIEDEIVYKLDAGTGISVWNVPISN
ncbi:MAG: PQQ-binding-like beta-propeller repeat protein [Dehalococcoidia bacterium]|nr:MAG: PQQ-binding-like beta-propeller repeat protein [Dehalococcoidia bacterium]